MTISEKQFQLIFEYAPLGMIIIGKDKKILNSNRAFQQMVGFTGQEIIDMGCGHILHPDDHSECMDIIGHLLNGRAVNEGDREVRYIHKDGRVIWVKINVSAHAFDPDGPMIIAVIEDITEQKKNETEVQMLRIAEDQMRESEERFRGAFETASHGMGIVSTEGRWLKVNQAMCQIVGYTETELLATDFQTITHPDDLDKDLEFVNKLLAGTIESYQMEKRYVHKNGHYFWILLSVSLVRNSKGEPLYFVSQIQDIDQRKKAEALMQKENHLNETLLVLTRERTTSIPELSMIAVNGAVKLTASRYGFFATVDEASGKITVRAWSRDVWAHCTMKEHQFDMFQKDLALLGMAVETKNPVVVNDYQVSGYLKHGIPDGHVDIERYLTVPLIMHGKVIAIISVANKKSDYDGDDTWVLSRFLEGTWSVIQHRIDEEAVEHARMAAEKASRAKSEFLANMSHEIRTPMNTIIGMGHLLSQTRLNPKQQNQMRKIQNAAETLLGIIDEILDFSKIETGHLTLENIPFDLDELMDNVASQISVKAHEKEIEILVSVPLHLPRLLVGDPLRLQQILLNLGSNAVKFTDMGDVTFSVDLEEDRKNKAILRFSVHDTGIGISRSQIGNLFKEFSQADSSTTRLYGGTGLGLAISKRLVDMMGGDINVQSEQGRGSLFSFTAVLEKQKEAKAGNLVPPDHLSGLRLLLAVDNKGSREILLAMASGMTFRATAAESGMEAFIELERSAASDDPFDLVLLDWHMPGMDGLETATRIKRHPTLKDTPVIVMMTAYSGQDIMTQAEELGVEGFLLKPLTPPMVLNAILDAFGENPDLTPENYPAAAQPVGPITVGPLDILVAEDHEINWEVIEAILSKSGIRPERAPNGSRAVDMVLTGKKTYDAVLMDLQMPLMDGYEATRWIRQTFDSKTLPIIAMTANALVSEKQRCLEAGMNDYLTKPVNVSALFKSLARWTTRPGAPIPETPPAYNPGPSAREEDLPGIDTQDLLSRIGGDVPLMKKLVRTFAYRHKDIPATLKTMFQTNDPETPRELHRIKGASGNIGAHKVFNIIADMEIALAHHKDDALATLLGQFEEAIKEITETAVSIDMEADAAPLLSGSEAPPA